MRIPNALWGSAFPAYGDVDGTMLVVDRETGRVQVYDPVARRWTQGSRAPRPMVVPNSPWVWTGEELIVFDSARPGRIQAYDPRADSWRALAASPLPGHDRAVWADGQVTVAGLGEEDGIEERVMASYDLTADTWTAIESAPGANHLTSLHWTGSEVLAVTSDEESGRVQVSALDSANGSWSEPVVGPVDGLFAQAVWTGDRLVFADDTTSDFVVDATYDPAMKTWELRDYACPVDADRAIWTGELMIHKGSDYAMDPSTGACYRLPEPGFQRSRIGRAAIWLEDRAIYWSGSSEPDVPYKRNGAAFVIEERAAAVSDQPRTAPG